MAFAFVHCLAGLEAFAKRDVAVRRPGWRLSYSRPGLVTYKHDEPELGAGPPTYFARVFGRSHRQLAGTGELAAASAAAFGATLPSLVHVYPRADEVDPEAVARWRAAAAAVFARVDAAAQGPELVADLVVEGDRAWLGSHHHGPLAAPLPGGQFDAPLPADAPSRAYGKAVEAIAWRGLAVEVGQRALEIGSAPGGATLALARRGVSVWGIDSAAMAPEVMAYQHPSGARVTHLAKKVGAVRWEELPPRFDWLLIDVNLAPQVALHEATRLVHHIGPHLRGAIVTLKMNDARSVDSIDALLARIAEWGLTDVACRHLPSNRAELCAVALRRPAA